MNVTFELVRTRVHSEDLTLYEKMVEQGTKRARTILNGNTAC